MVSRLGNAFPSPPNQNDPFTKEDLIAVKEALSAAIDEVLAYSDAAHGEIIVIFITDLVSRYKLTYLLTPEVIGQLLELCFSREPFRSIVEEMTARFYLNLPEVGLLWTRLTRVLAKACSLHNNEQKATLLPEDITSNTVTTEQALSVLAAENWLVFVTALIAYHDPLPLKAIKNKLNSQG
jgi:hypothetical protein